MNRFRETFKIPLAVVLAVAIPAIAWHLSTSYERLNLGLTAPLFGWPRLLLAHLVAATPVAYCLARRSRSWGTPAIRICLAAARTVLIAVMLPILDESLDPLGISFWWRALLRTVIAILITTAWIFVLIDEPQAAIRLPWVATLAFAIVPPTVYAHRLTEARVNDFENYAKSGRLVRAMGALQKLRELGSNQTFLGKSVTDLIPRLENDIRRLATQADQPLDSQADLSTRLGRATLLLQLSRTAEASEVLRPISTPTADVWLMRAAIAREAGQWAELEVACQMVTGCSESVTPEMLEIAYDGLGEAQRHSGRPAAAAETYTQAAERLPDRVGYYRYQSGLLAAERGRPDEAIDLLTESIRLDPRLTPLVEPQLRRIRTHTLSCLGRW